MKRTTIIIALIAFLAGTLVTIPVSAGLNAFRNSIETALGTDFNNGNRNEIGQAFADAYPGEWQAAVAAGTYNDNNNGRVKFAAFKIAEYVTAIRASAQRNAALNTVPTPIPLPDN